MASILVIFSGQVFSYNVLDRAIDWAQEHEAILRVLFLKEEPVKEGYLYPSDIDAAEALTDEADVRQDDEQILQGKIKLVKDTAAAAGIDCTIQVGTDHSADAILATAENVDIIFVDMGTERGEEAAGQPFKVSELIEKAACPVELIKAE